MEIPEELKTAADDVAHGKDRHTSPRVLISWFGAHRRGYWVVKRIREALTELGLTTNPDFEYAWLDENIVLTRAQPSSEAPPTNPNVTADTSQAQSH